MSRQAASKKVNWELSTAAEQGIALVAPKRRWDAENEDHVQKQKLGQTQTSDDSSSDTEVQGQARKSSFQFDQ